MVKNNKGPMLPILAKGEKYTHDTEPPASSGGPKKYPWSFGQARNHLMPLLEKVKQETENIPQSHRVSEVVITADLLPDFLSKSYLPESLFCNSNLKIIGSRSITVPITEERRSKRGKNHLEKEESRRLFLSGDNTSIEKLIRTLDDPKIKSVKEQFQKLSSFSLQTIEQKLFGIKNDFNGLAEVVLHGLPSYLRDEEIKKFLSLCRKFKLKCNVNRIRSYQNGPVFCTVSGKSENLHWLAKYNPLRVVRPSPELPSFQTIRSTKTSMPSITEGNNSPTLTVGMFDGGVDLNHPALKYIVNEESLTPQKANIDFVQHGTAVASALTYGPIDASVAELPSPRVGIHSFRVFPVPPSQNDTNLNYVIDQIEDIVPQRDIEIYNLSIGPKKPIEDDDIDRFTYALDRLALRHNVVFFIAAGNDGLATSPYNRIQPAADMVNGVGVGALTRNIEQDGTSQMIHAPYSCVGPGRIGARRKPDISAFGGCQNHPFVVLGNNDYNSLSSTSGTSFSCPTVAGLAGSIRSSQKGFLNPLAVRTLLLHSSKKMTASFDQVGIGEAQVNVDEILHCTKNKVTVIYQDEISYGGYCALPILLPDIPGLNGTVKINWTLIYMAKTNPNSPDEYTLEQLDVKFRPHDRKYSFTKNGKSKAINIHTDKASAEEFIANGYKKSKIPWAKSSKKPYMTEQDLRIQGKWNNTVIVGEGNTRFDGLRNPALTLHITERYNGTDIPQQEAVRYACAITIETKKEFNLYEKILQKFRQLTPLRTRERIRL